MRTCMIDIRTEKGVFCADVNLDDVDLSSMDYEDFYGLRIAPALKTAFANLKKEH